MTAEAPLLAIAEISVALVGFSSIVVAIRGTNPNSWSQQDRVGLANVFAASVAALIGSLLPFPLQQLGLAEHQVWSASNAAFGLLLLSYLVFLLFRQRGTPPRVPFLFWLLVASGFLLGLALLLAAAGLVVLNGPGLLLVALMFSLLAALAQLATFLLLSTSSR